MELCQLNVVRDLLVKTLTNGEINSLNELELLLYNYNKELDEAKHFLDLEATTYDFNVLKEVIKFKVEERRMYLETDNFYLSKVIMNNFGQEVHDSIQSHVDFRSKSKIIYLDVDYFKNVDELKIYIQTLVVDLDNKIKSLKKILTSVLFLSSKFKI